MADHGHSHGCGHGHSHEGGAGGGGHGHSHGPSDASDAENLKAQEYNLYLKIDMDSLTCLNEEEDGSGKTVFRAFEDRLERTKFVSSDVDEELLFNIPFTGVVKLKGLLIIGGERETHPNKMRLFKNRPNMSFEDAGAAPDQDIDVHVDQEGLIEYKPIFPMVKTALPNEVQYGQRLNTALYLAVAKNHVGFYVGSEAGVARFNDVSHLSIHFPSNHGNSEKTEIFYIGLKGEFSEAHRHEVTITAYEARANPADHKTSSVNQVNQMIS